MTSRIKFGAPREDQIEERRFPSDLLTNSVQTDGLTIFLDWEAWKRLCDHGDRHVDHAGPNTVECAGLLAGKVFYDSDRQQRFVVIKDAVPTDAESQSAGSVRIVPEDFERARHQIHGADLRVVGWYHTHPNYGIFLSQDDRLVVQSLFNASWHIAMVYDPMRNQLGCFYGPDCIRVDDHDENVPIKRNFVVVTDWKGFWNDRAAPLAVGTTTHLEAAPEVPTEVPTDIVPDSVGPSAGEGVPFDSAQSAVAAAVYRPAQPHEPPQRQPLQRRTGWFSTLSLIGFGFALALLLVGGWYFFGRAAPLKTHQR